MFRKGWATSLLFAALAIAVVAVSGSQALAQCAMCRTGIGGSPSAAKLAQSLNFAIIVLLIPPVLIFCGIFFAAFKSKKAQTSQASGVEKSSGRARLSKIGLIR